MSQAEIFHALHAGPDVLVLPNAWDAGSAAIMRSLGAKAIATTSAGCAWSLGWPDGDCLPIDRAVEVLSTDRLVLMHEGHRVAHGSAEEVLRPETLGEFYGVSVRVHREPDGTIIVVPSRTPDLR